MQIACCQFDIAWEDKPDNYRKVAALVRGAKLEPGTLLLLPEMFATGFSMASERNGEPPDGPTVRFLSELAAEHRVHVLGGVAVADPTTGRRVVRNEAVAVGPDGRRVTRYAKVQLFSLAGEDRHYEPGEAVGGFDWSGCRVAPFVCYDLRFPELFRRAVSTPDARAELLAVIANWPLPRDSHWLALLRARAIENQAYVAAVNRIGHDGNGLTYFGRSQVIDPRGEVIADAGEDETVIRAEVDLGSVREWRRAFPALDDIRLNVRSADPA